MQSYHTRYVTTAMLRTSAYHFAHTTLIYHEAPPVIFYCLCSTALFWSLLQAWLLDVRPGPPAEMRCMSCPNDHAKVST